MTHSIVLETGSAESFERYRYQVRGFCSDQGVEALLCDAGLPMSPTCDNLHAWDDCLEAGRRGELPSVPHAYLFPLCLFIPDHLHMLFGAWEYAVKTCAGWEAMEEKLRAISSFLRNEQYRLRFVQTCLGTPEEKALFSSYQPSITDWKWEYLT